MLLDDSVPKAVLSYACTDPVLVVQIQGLAGSRPPRRWPHLLLERLAEEHESFIVQSSFNNLYALDFHAFLRTNGIYRDAGIGDPSFLEATKLSPGDRAKVMVSFERIPAQDRPVSRLHPSTAFVRYDVTARSFASAYSRSCVADTRGSKLPNLRIEGYLTRE